MSIESRSWAWSLEHLRPAVKLTLLVLADLADEAAKCSCSQKHLMRLTCQSEGTVKRVLRELQYYGLIERIAQFRPDGGQCEDAFHLHLEITNEHLAKFVEEDENGATAFIYVISRGHMSKVGISRAGGGCRLETLRNAAPGEQLYLNWQSNGPASIIRKIERAAHDALREHWVSSEWFMVDPDFAIEIVKTEMAKFGLRA